MRELCPIFLGECCLRGRRVVGAVAKVEALLVGLGEIQDAERLTHAPRRVGALPFRIESAEQLVALHPVRVAAKDLGLRLHGLVQVLRDVARVELGQDLASLLVVRIEGLRRLVGVDGHLRLAEELVVQLGQLVEDLRDPRAILGFLRAVELELEHALDAVVIALLAA